jgi:subtilase family serine protease
VAGLWQQAALEGVSVIVASGDGGAAGCDDFNTERWAVSGIQANGLASTPYNLAVGGTDFLDTSENANSLYWSTTNGPGGKSAKSYVPETAWNDSCAGSVLFTFARFGSGIDFCNSGIGLNFLDILASGGAPSFIYAKPLWQKVVYGVPSDGVRDTPDVSLFGSNGFWNHAILFCMSDPKQGGVPCDYSKPVNTLNNSAGGTSFTAPQFASIQALINQKTAARQGNPAPIYYVLAAFEYGLPSLPNKTGQAYCNASLGIGVSPLCGFHDVTSGNIDVPCFGTNNCYGSSSTTYGVLSTSDTTLSVAYPATPAWDFATGLGSINVTNIVSVWP